MTFSNFSIIILVVRTVLGLRGFSTAFSRGNYTSPQIKRGATILYDSMTDMEDSRPNIYWFEELDSTMTKAKELIAENTDRSSFAVVAGHQNAGRGTRGRTWVSGSSNLFLTVVLRMKEIPTPLTLIPLRVGTLIIPSIQSRVTSGELTVLKWPNDVLIGEEKICGVLIEVEGDFMIIGIGCNIMTAPEVVATGGDNGRPATCLSRHMNCNTDLQSDQCAAIGELHKEIAAEIYGALASHILLPTDPAERVIADFERYMNFAPQKLRGENEVGSVVTPFRVNKDGTLQVQVLADKSERTLVAEYLW